MKFIPKSSRVWSVFGLLCILFALVCAYLFTQTQTTNVPQDTFLVHASDFEKAEYYFSDEHYDVEKARYYYTQSIQADPEGEVLQWYQLARINFIEGDFEGALYNLDKQYEYFGEQVPNINYTYGLVYGFRADLEKKPEDFKLAEKHFLKFLESEPDSPWARVDLAWIYFSMREFPNMITALQPVYDEQQNNPWVLNMYGLALLNTGKTKEAVEHLSRANDLASGVVPEDWAAVYPGNSPAHWEAGTAEFKKAVQMNLQLAQRRLQKDGDNPENDV
jgi:tetratricopeptide (TPR) repeat protein